MRRILAVAALLVQLTCLRADLIWYEPFNYVDGQIIVTGTNVDGSTNWFRHSGSGNDAIVFNGKLEVATGNTGSRQDDVHRKLAVVAESPYTNFPQVLYASFTVNFTNLPTANGHYFAHFMTNNTTGFMVRLFALTGNPTGTSNVFSALPGTFRLGVSSVSSGSPNVIFPLDLALNTDYQVVIGWDPVTLYATTLWINPLSSGDSSVTTSDTVTTILPLLNFAFRQPSGVTGFLKVTNLAVATTFDEAAASVWSTTPKPPSIAYQPQSATNFVGEPASVSVVANGQGLASLSYQWRKNGANIANPAGNTNVFYLASGAAANSGKYDVIATQPATGLSVTSTTAFLWITNPPIPPTIVTHPTNREVFFGQTASFVVVASGADLSYQWYRNNGLLSGETSSSITIPNVRADNNTTGTYRCDVTNPFGTTPSSNAVLTAVAPPTATIGYLRTLVDPVYFLPTNTTALWTVSGIVTTHTNVTTAANSSFYMQDNTGGINVFFAGNNQARPQAGDHVTVTGPLGQFNSLLELNLTALDPAHSVVTNSSGNPLPAGIVLPFSFTNSPAYGGVSNAIRLYQGAVVTFTNVYFADANGITNFQGGGRNYLITNTAGERFTFRVDSRVGDIIGKTIPSFAWTVTGPMGFFLSPTATDRSAGYQILPTRFADIVTTPPPAVTVSAAIVAGKPVLNWTAQPYMSYSVLRALNVSGPYLPLANGLTFNTTAGQYTDNTPAGAAAFYQIISP